MEFDVSLVVITEHIATYNSFLQREGIVLQSFQDHSSGLFEKKLISTAPIKIYFDNNNKATIAENIGASINISDFLKKIH